MGGKRKSSTGIALGTLLAAAAGACLVSESWLASLPFWIGAAYCWHRWTEAAWGSSPAGLAVDRACWFGALAHLGGGELMREFQVPGWSFLWACAGLLWLAGLHALRPRLNRASLPAAAWWCLALATLCWPAFGIALGAAAEDTGSGLGLGFFFSLLAILAICPVWASQEPKVKSQTAPEGSLAEDLALLWATALPEPREREAPELDPLSGYQFSSKAAQEQDDDRAAKARTHASIDRPTLVESGAFRVDAEKALEKLSRFRSAEPLEFALGLFRAAVSAGATRVEVGRHGDGLELRFDGRPLDSAALADPMGALLTTGLSGAERELSGAMLSALALPRCRVYVASGEGAARHRLRAAPRGFSAADEPPDTGDGTSVIVHWRWASGRDAALDLLRRRIGMIGFSWAIAGVDQPAGPNAAAPTGWWSPPMAEHRLRLAPLRDIRNASRLRLYRLGTLIEEVSVEALVPSPVDACVRDDAFTLDLSQAKVVRDARYKAALDLVKDRFGDFRSWLKDEHEDRWPQLQRAAAGSGAGQVWNRLRRAVGWRSKADVEKDAWDRAVRQWLEATRGS